LQLCCSAGVADIAGDAGVAGVAGDAGTGGGVAGAAGAAPINLITNGDFSLGEAFWNVQLNAGVSGTYTTSGALCVTNTTPGTYLSVTLGFPVSAADSFSVEAGSSYTLSFRAYGALGLTLEVKVGEVVTPWTPVATFYQSLSTLSYQSYSYLVTPVASMAQTGLAFNAVLDYAEYGGMICLDDVSFVKN
jgi:hypothetical protein